ncbi:MIP18 family protein galla-2-like [Actinia tenebrosa]|uniref:MIP18 family protein galla-2-like n=1 Tax=Actinia tenebrosa TaxID=6105 RepID=A0A6P8IEH0_ACTTE|nr:MIP18 family protein galla-2-like [Actinia tenebrosa]
MAAVEFENVNPAVFERAAERVITVEEEDENHKDKIDSREVFDMIRFINDPEHPLTLEELNVVQQSLVEVSDDESQVKVQFTPTIPHCSMATLIGLAIRVKLLRSLPERFKVDVTITPGAHQSELAVNKQLADKERVAAALENSHLLEVINQCLVRKK